MKKKDFRYNIKKLRHHGYVVCFKKNIYTRLKIALTITTAHKNKNRECKVYLKLQNLCCQTTWLLFNREKLEVIYITVNI